MKTLSTKLLLLACISCFSFLEICAQQDFPNPLPIPYQIKSDNILLEMSEHEHSFNPGDPTHYLNKPVKAFAFNEVGSSEQMTILGPSIVWNYKAQLHNEVTNNIDRVSTTHWHGAHVPAHADGGPHQKIQVGDTWEVDFEVLDKSATMWYHPHAIDITYEQVQMGLSGMIYVEDPFDGVGDDAILTQLHEILPTDYGVNDFPLIFQTKFFALVDSATMTYRIKDELGFSTGYEYMVNGVLNPHLDVPDNMIRLRVLNGDGKFTFKFAIHDENFEPVPFQLIATDAGYTDQSYAMESIYMAPGERTEWLVNLRGQAGKSFYIYNAISQFPNDGSIIGDTVTTSPYVRDTILMRLDVEPNINAPLSPIVSFPINLVDVDKEIPTIYPWTNRRVKTFYQDTLVSNCDSTWVVANTKKPIFTIDHAPMSLHCVNDVVMVDSTEVWEIVNTTDRGHPFHIHDIHFWVIDAWNNVTDEPIIKSQYPNIFKGPKDNVMVFKDWTIQFVTNFADFGTAIAPDSCYMYHCHILPHEDKGMMGQFVVWNGIISDVETSLDPSLSMKLYPNPASDILNLESASEKESQVRIYNTQGQLLGKRTLAPFSGQTYFSVADIPRGLVLVEWITNDGRVVSKVMIQ
ncbi:MAG: multicopper oxidase domain-containing protein [Bacteroidia bacterium]|nr:multicopper oxidase domain-containing protein [Bacteroidia bacterium]